MLQRFLKEKYLTWVIKNLCPQSVGKNNELKVVITWQTDKNTIVKHKIIIALANIIHLHISQFIYILLLNCFYNHSAICFTVNIHFYLLGKHLKCYLLITYQVYKLTLREMISFLPTCLYYQEFQSFMLVQQLVNISAV